MGSSEVLLLFVPEQIRRLFMADYHSLPHLHGMYSGADSPLHHVLLQTFKEKTQQEES